jgi:CBS domain-containing protein
MFKVKDVMSTEIVTVTRATSLDDAIALLLDKKVSGLPVVDDAMGLVGVITEKDMLELLAHGNPVGETVADHMTADVVTFAPDDSLYDVAECFRKRGFRRVPIVDGGRLVGVVARRDVIRAIAKLRKMSR